MAGSGFIKQMIDSSKENLAKLNKGKLKGFETKHKYDGLDSGLLNKEASEESLKYFRERAIKMQKRESLKQITITLILLLFFGIIISFYIVAFFARQ